jgi:ABC-2 type transport system ATP-binding protein
MTPAININDLRFSYGSKKGRVEALRGINLQVPAGEVFGFIGPNGAGKTTTIKHLLGIIPSKEQHVTIFGASPSSPFSRKRLGYMPENSRYYGFLTPMELLRMYGDICFVERNIITRRARYLLDMVGLSGHADKRLSTFSKGMMQKVSFAQALINDPDLLILDEPTGGLDPLARKNMRHVISDLKEQGKTVFFSSHELSEVELVADKIGVIDRGIIAAAGPVKDLMGSKGAEQTLENYFLQLLGDDR